MLLHSYNIHFTFTPTYANTMEVLSATYSRLLFPTLVPNTGWPSKAIGEVQKKFTRKIKLEGKLDYWQRLKVLRLYSQERRRERYRIIYVWKILKLSFLSYTWWYFETPFKKWQDNAITYGYQ